jgi:hypothetical protein
MPAPVHTRPPLQGQGQPDAHAHHRHAAGHQRQQRTRVQRVAQDGGEQQRREQQVVDQPFGRVPDRTVQGGVAADQVPGGDEQEVGQQQQGVGHLARVCQRASPTLSAQPGPGALPGSGPNAGDLKAATMIVRRPVLCALALSALPWAPLAAQVTLEGQTFDARARVGGQDLPLNGVGLRAVAWLKGYAAGLYLPQKSGSADAVLAMPGPKRLQLRMLQQVSTQEFVKAFDRGVKRNTPEADLPALTARMQQFDAIVSALGTVRKGDVVDLDFVPGRGLLFVHNGKRHGEVVKGDDFYAALLRIFIGAKPTDPELKTGLLGGPVS